MMCIDFREVNLDFLQICSCFVTSVMFLFHSCLMFYSVSQSWCICIAYIFIVVTAISLVDLFVNSGGLLILADSYFAEDIFNIT